MSKGNVLVTGGAGYVGSHTCLALAESGYTPVVLDNFSNGHREFVQWGPCVEGDIRDAVFLKKIFNEYSFIGVMHFAAKIEVGESVRSPNLFYETNVSGAINVINAAHHAGVKSFVFSSTCATYGEPVFLPMDETHQQMPLNPYGQSKYIVEKILEDMRRYCGFPSVILRYFNAAGADPKARLGEWHEPETHALPLLLDVALGKRDQFFIFGSDYDTPDGTCVRDYVHVLDLADAHVKALEMQLAGDTGDSFNLGTGEGTTVKALVEAVENVVGRKLNIMQAGRRTGDSPSLVADNQKALNRLGWKPGFDLNVIIEDAWRWHCKLRAMPA